jgi:hypothetical protein
MRKINADCENGFGRLSIKTQTGICPRGSFAAPLTPAGSIGFNNRNNVYINEKTPSVKNVYAFLW